MMKRRALTALSFLALTVATACGGSSPPAAPPPPPPPPAAPPPAASADAVGVPASPPTGTPTTPTYAPAEPPASTAVWKLTDSISTPESVLYDAAADRYLVSNINGSPTGVDNNGYISEVSPEGKLIKAKFIEGGAGKTKLDAPKGSGIHNGIFYVTDITVVRKFDAKTGAPKGDIPVKDSVFLNDLAIAPDGRIFVSDSGMKVGEKGLEPAGGDAVYEIDKTGKVKTLAKATDLTGPNGLVLLDKKLVVVALKSDEAYTLNDKGEKQEVTHLPKGGLDGVVALGGDTLLISSWAGSAVYRGKLGSSFEPVLHGVKSPADIGFDTKRNRVLVPHFTENSIEAFDLK
jgi:hypothetical protein